MMGVRVSQGNSLDGVGRRPALLPWAVIVAVEAAGTHDDKFLMIKFVVIDEKATLSGWFQLKIDGVVL